MTATTPPHHLATQLCFDTLFTLAERETGAYGLADGGLRQRVAAMVDWINRRGPYTPEQVSAMQRQLQRLLVNRLRLVQDRQRFPAIADEQITRPIFIIGFPRSGTTLLHSLLAEDPDSLSLRSWHSLTPSPPPGAGPVCRGRMASAQRLVDQWMDFCPGQQSMHPYVDQGALQPIEDEEVFTLDFRNAYPLLLWRVPTLDAMDIDLGDAAGTFGFHRQVLQHLQWNTGKQHWVCKGPSHQNNLQVLFDTYPDALCVWTHRPIEQIYASNVALRAATYDTIRGAPQDWSSQARDRALAMKAAVDRLMANDLIDDPRILHLPFRELTDDPVAAVQRIYRQRGRPFGAAAEQAVRGWLNDPENRSDRYGRYPYTYEAFGLDRDWVRELFADYTDRFCGER